MPGLKRFSNSASTKSRDVDGSIYLLAIAIAGLVLFLAVLLGGGTSDQQKSADSKKAHAVAPAEIVPYTPDIGYSGK